MWSHGRMALQSREPEMLRRADAQVQEAGGEPKAGGLVLQRKARGESRKTKDERRKMKDER